MASTTVASYFLLSALLLSASALAEPAAPQALAACAARPADDRVPATADIDYAAINQHLTNPDGQQRHDGLQADVRSLARSRAPEAVLVRHRLTYALAQSQAAMGKHDAAMATLRQLPTGSPQAPEALALMAELEIANGKPDAAVRWLLHLADLFPEESGSVSALWRAAELSEPASPRGLALLRQAAQHADNGLSVAKRWRAQSREAGFLEEMDNGPLPPELWRLARSALVSAAFASADATQEEARRQLRCLSANREAQLRQMDRNPRLLADLDDSVDTMTAQLRSARDDLLQREQRFLATAASLKDCRARVGDCAALKDQHDRQGRELTGWRNRLQTLEGRLAFLRTQKEALRRSESLDRASTAVASRLGSRLDSSGRVMQEKLQQSLDDAVQEWERLSAQAHYRLALAQESHVDPGAVPAPPDQVIASP